MKARPPRSCILILIVLGLVSASELTAARKLKSRKPYRVIFNCDGHAVAKDANGDLEQWLKNLFDPLEASHVDALFWCDGAGGNTANYDSQVLERTGARLGQGLPYIDKWIKEGNDPPRVVVAEARKRGIDVFYSFRINDIHDSFIPEEMPTYKVDNPDWLIGERDYGGVTSFKTALNFAIPEVRALKERVIIELFEKYDFDGLEIDFLRSAPYFLPGTESANAPLLTEMLRRIRKHLNERGRERGRPIRLAVRVNESLDSCRKDGFEVATWIEDGLVDIVTLGSGVMDIEIEQFKELAKRKPVHIYPCLYGWPSKYSPIPAELATGLALNYWQQGADGIYLFNWFPHTTNNSESTGPYMAGLLKKIGNPDLLSSSQSHWMFAADRGRPQRAYQYNWLHCILPAGIPLKGSLKPVIRVGKQVPAGATARLQLEIENLQPDDRLRITINGTGIDNLIQDRAGRLVAPLPAGILQLGRNVTTIQFEGQPADPTLARTVTALEIHVEVPATSN